MSTDAAEIRAACAEETDAVLHVLCAAFGLSYEAARPLFYADPFFDLSLKRLLRTSQEGIVSCLTVIPTRIRIGGAWVSLAGIAGVATLPQSQGRGHAGRLLAATVPDLSAELHFPIAGLFAYAEDYYRKFGWETVSEAVHYSGPLAGLADHTEVDCVRYLGKTDAAGWECLRQLHATLTPERTGTCLRDHRRWRILEAAPERVWVIYQEPNKPPSGYAVYEWSENAEGHDLCLLEMRGEIPAARRGLVGHLARQRDKAAHWEWLTSPDDYAAFDLLASDSSKISKPGLMLRLTDTAAALAAVHAANFVPVLSQMSRTLTVRSVDPICPKNTVPVRLAAAAVELGTDTDPDWIAADVRTLAQCYFGYRTPSAAAAQGVLHASSPMALALADALFPARAPFVAPLDQF